MPVHFDHFFELVHAILEAVNTDCKTTKRPHLTLSNALFRSTYGSGRTCTIVGLACTQQLGTLATMQKQAGFLLL